MTPKYELGTHLKTVGYDMRHRLRTVTGTVKGIHYLEPIQYFIQPDGTRSADDWVRASEKMCQPTNHQEIIQQNYAALESEGL